MDRVLCRPSPVTFECRRNRANTINPRGCLQRAWNLFPGDALVRCDRAQDGIVRSSVQRMMIRHAQPLVPRFVAFDDDVAADPLKLAITPPVGDRSSLAVVSSCHEHFVTHKAKADAFRRGPVEKVCLDRLTHIPPELIPGVRLGSDPFAQRLGNETTVRFLGDFKYQFLHKGQVHHRVFADCACRSNVTPTPIGPQLHVQAYLVARVASKQRSPAICRGRHG